MEEKMGKASAFLATGVAVLGGLLIAPEVSAKTEEMVLTEDTEITEVLTIEEGDTLTIDLDRYTLTLANTSSSRLIQNHGTLTIKSDKGGTLTDADDVAEPYGMVDNYGTLNIEGSDIRIVENGNGNGSTLKNRGGAMNVLSGSFSILADNLGNAAIYSDGTLNVADGVRIESSSNRAYGLIVNSGEATIGDVYSHGVHGGFSINSGRVVVNGGDYASENYYGVWITNDGETTDVTINGGKFTGRRYGLYTAVDDGRQDAGNVGVVINDGQFKGGTKAAVAMNSSSSERDWGLEVRGGEFSTDPAEYVPEGYVREETLEAEYPYSVRPEVTGLVLSEDEVTLGIGEEKWLTVTTTPEGLEERVGIYCGAKDDPDGGSVAWCYYDETNNALVVYGVEAGEETFVVLADDASVEFTVTVEEALKSGGDYEHLEEEGYGGYVEFETAVEGATKIEISAEEVPEAVDEDLKAVFNIRAVDENGDEVPVANNEIFVTLQLDKEMFGEYQYFQIVYLNDDGEVVEYIDPESVVDEFGYYFIMFRLTHLSQYGVLAANEEFAPAEERNAEIPGDDEGDDSEDEGSESDSGSDSESGESEIDIVPAGSSSKEAGSPDTGRVTAASGAAVSSALGAVVAAGGASVVLRKRYLR